MQIENRQAHTLFGVVTLFLMGNSLRIILNIQEAFTDYVRDRPRITAGNIQVPS